MTKISMDNNTSVVRCQSSRRALHKENCTEDSPQPSMTSRTKLMTRSSLLLVSVLISTNWMLAKGVSFSSSMGSPSMSPTASFVINNEPQREEEWLTSSSSTQIPSSSPTSHSKDSKNSKKQKKEKTRSGRAPSPPPPPESTTGDVGTGSKKRRKRIPKGPTKMEEQSELPTAFGLRTKSSSVSSRPVSKLQYKNQKSRIRPATKKATLRTRTKTTAFVRDCPVQRRALQYQQHQQNRSEINGGSTSTDKKQKKSKSSKKRSLDGNQTSGPNPEDAQHSFHSKRKTANSPRRRRSELDSNPTIYKANSDAQSLKKERHQKKNKKRSKEGDDKAAIPQITRTRQEKAESRQMDDSTLSTKITAENAGGKLPKRKRRKKDNSLSTALDEGATSSALDGSRGKHSFELEIHDSVIKPKTDISEDVKHTKKSKHRKKSSPKLDETDSSSIIKKDELLSEIVTPMPAVEMSIESTEQEENNDDGVLTETKQAVVDELSQSQLQENDGNLPQVTSDAIETSEATPISIDEEEAELVDNAEPLNVVPASDSAGTEVEDDQSADGIVEEAKEEMNDEEELVSIERSGDEEDEAFAEQQEEEADDKNENDEIDETAQNQEEDTIIEEEKAPHDDVSALEEEVDEGIGGDELSNTRKENIENKRDAMTRREGEEADIVSMNTPTTDQNHAADESKIEEKVIYQESNGDLIEDEGAEIVVDETSEENRIDYASTNEAKSCDEEIEESDTQKEEQTEVAEEKLTQKEEEMITDDSSTEENSVEKSHNTADTLHINEDEAITGETDGNPESEEPIDGVDNENQVGSAPEESSMDALNQIEDEVITEDKNSETDSDETAEIDNENDHGSDHQNTLELSEKENKTRRGVSIQDDSNLEISSSENSDVDPDQDVVSFIEEVLNENVRSWIKTSDSNFENIVNKTRGGHTDVTSNVDEKTLDADVITTVLDECSDDDVSQTSEIVEDSCEPTFEDTEGSTEEMKGKFRIIDRDTLEKLEDKKSDAVVSVVTWNLAEDSPSEEDAAFIRKFRKNGVLPDEGSDLVLISGQECENIKPRRSEGRRSREYRRLMIKMLGRGYVPLALHLLGGIQFGLFAKRSFLEEIEDISVADVTCGIGNVFHNKGAIAAFVKVRARNENKSDEDKKRSKSLRMVFVTAHLAAHVKNADARDSDFWRISAELEAQAPEGFLPRKPSNAESNGSFLFDSVDRVFFCGDLNYRCDLPRELTEHAILYNANADDKSPITDLLRHDQLIHSMAEGRAFPGFGEGKITFMPTFKYDKESSSYDTSHKQRIPAWTDRILFQPADGIRVLDYQSVPEAQSSDHRPVYGTYRIGMEGRVITPSVKKRKRKRIQESIDNDYY